MGSRRSFLRVALAAAAAKALPGHSQQGKALPRVGWLLWQRSGPFAETIMPAFERGLRDEGFVDGVNVVLARRYADGELARFARLAAELAREKVDVFFAPTKPMADAAWYASRTIPIVIATIGDPVALDFVKSLARPGTRVTGVTTATREITAKRTQLLTEVVPGLKRLGIVIDEPMLKACGQEVKFTEEAAERLGVTLVRAYVSDPARVDSAFQQLAQQRVQGAMTTLLSTRHGMEREFIAASLRQRIPMMHELAEHAQMGALLAYGPDYEDVFRRAGRCTGRILKGADPATLPIEEPNEFRLVVNAATARNLGIALPESLLLRADRVIG